MPGGWGLLGLIYTMGDAPPTRADMRVLMSIFVLDS